MRSYYALRSEEIINEEGRRSAKSPDWKRPLRYAQDKLVAPFRKK